jgi:hypothetical protein
MTGPHIRLEILADDGTAIPMKASLSLDQPPGTLSSDPPEGRRIYMFGLHNGQIGVWESKGGYDIENDAIRLVGSIELELLSDLSEPYTLTLHKGGIDHHLRLTLVTLIET